MHHWSHFDPKLLAKQANDLEPEFPLLTGAGHLHKLPPRQPS